MSPRSLGVEEEFLLADAGDADAVAGLLADLVARGNGAAFQREEYRRSERLPEMTSRAVDITVA